MVSEAARDRQVARETVRPRSECPSCDPGQPEDHRLTVRQQGRRPASRRRPPGGPTMTLYTVSETWARCDGTITAACDVYHPDTPHACPAQILCPPGSYVIDTLTPAGWLTIDVGPARRHYCPAHHDQAPRP